jgi:hypothetical protein
MSSLITAYQTLLLPVWNHPYLTFIKESNERTNLKDISKALEPQLKKSFEVAEVSMESTSQIEDDSLRRSNEQTGSSWGIENSSDGDNDSDDGLADG